MNLKERGKGLSHKQVSASLTREDLVLMIKALAAIGQGRLIALWDNLFSQLDQPIAQILLTRMDISDVSIPYFSSRRPRLTRPAHAIPKCAKHLFRAAANGCCPHCQRKRHGLRLSTCPTHLSTESLLTLQEIKFGDNDTLSAISSAIVHADYLFLLTDVEAL